MKSKIFHLKHYKSHISELADLVVDVLVNVVEASLGVHIRRHHLATDGLEA
jgi:hypothetical protein